jgi:hypothetical protein
MMRKLLVAAKGQQQEARVAANDEDASPTNAWPASRTSGSNRVPKPKPAHQDNPQKIRGTSAALGAPKYRLHLTRRCNIARLPKRQCGRQLLISVWITAERHDSHSALKCVSFFIVRAAVRLSAPEQQFVLLKVEELCADAGTVPHRTALVYSTSILAASAEFRKN